MASQSRLKALQAHLVRQLPRLAAANQGVPRTNCLRLCAGHADGIEGMVVDCFGPVVVATDYAAFGADAPAGRELLEALKHTFPAHVLIAKVKVVADGSNTFVTERFTPETSPPLVAYEQGLAFEVGTDPAHDFGLYLDAAQARHYVRGVSAGKRVLNLFSYTGAFGIAAAVGGAAEVTNIDPNRDYLTWSLRNAALNKVQMRVLPDTTQDFLARHLRRLQRKAIVGFDLVIVDPPAFGVGRGNERLLRLLWPQIFESLRAMAPEHLVLLCNDKYFRNRKGFDDLANKELSEFYTFTHLGTCLEVGERKNSGEDPHYLEPTVLAGVRR